MKVRSINKTMAWFFVALLALSSSGASAWWNKEWASRKQLVLDAGITGADLKENLTDAPVLVRLHAGNFGYFSELAEGGSDLRFQLDDKTPLKYHIEKIDPVNEMALVWVRVPQINAQANSDAFWLYYGNSSATAGEDSGATYDTAQVLVYHFGDAASPPKDATAYHNHASASAATQLDSGWIGAAASFDGSGAIKVDPSPSLAIDPVKGWTFSAWIKSDRDQSATVFEAREGANALVLKLQGSAVSASYNDQQTPAASLPFGEWQHVAVVLQGGKIELYLDGVAVGSAAASPVAFNPALSIGGSDGKYLTGAIDEVSIANVARSASWLKFQARSQGADFSTLNFGEDEAYGGAGDAGYFSVIMRNITVDGWVVIALTGVMLVVAVWVIVLKSVVIIRVKNENKLFLAQYDALDPDADPAQLDHDDPVEASPSEHTDALLAGHGKHDHFQSSTLYHLYHLGIREVKKRFGGTSPLVTAEALNLVQVRLDAAVVREAQKLNRNMVLLTIAIAGGPFLGLLGTVMGVMITFAAIAATGDVNINSIAPGIAAALAATVAGLAVAIPALFGYNYLLTQIKDITADMRVFSDEFVAALAARGAALRARGES